jgi:hypothetical protein
VASNTVLNSYCNKGTIYSISLPYNGVEYNISLPYNGVEYSISLCIYNIIDIKKNTFWGPTT